MHTDETGRAKRSVGGIAFTGALAVGFLVFGALCVYDAVLWTYRQEAAWYWPSAPGQIIGLHSHVRGGPSVEYSYTVNGKFYRTSAELPLLGRTRFTIGNLVAVRFNPQKPQISVFAPGFSWVRLWQLAYGLFFLMWSAVMAMLTIDGYRHPENTTWSFGWRNRTRKARAGLEK